MKYRAYGLNSKRKQPATTSWEPGNFEEMKQFQNKPHKHQIFKIACA